MDKGFYGNNSGYLKTETWNFIYGNHWYGQCPDIEGTGDGDHNDGPTNGAYPIDYNDETENSFDND